MFAIEDYIKELGNIVDFSKLYEKFRIVDPFTNKVYKFCDKKLIVADTQPCYKVWGIDVPCVNCVSMRACIENKEIVKIECAADSVAMILSKPITIDNRLYAVELAKNITDSLVITDGYNDNSENVQSLINNINNIAVTDGVTGLFSEKNIKDKLKVLCQENIKSYLFIIDIDNLNLIIELYGRLAGEDAIKQSADILKELDTQHGFMVGRLNKAEFVVIAQQCEKNVAQLLCDRAASRVEQIKLIGGEKEIFVKVTYGSAEYQIGDTVQNFLQRAYDDMYNNKILENCI